MKNLFTARALLKELNAEQNQVLTQNTLRGSATAGEWLALIAKLRRVDRVIGGAKGMATWLVVLGIVLLIGGFLGKAWWLGEFLGRIWWLPASVGAIALLLGLPFLFSFSGKKVHGNLLRFAAPVLAMLREDTDEKTPFDLKLDFRGARVGSKRAGVRKWPGNELPAGARSRTDSVFNDPIFSLSTKLVDGSRLAFSIVDQVTERRTGKISRSGKHKTKWKFKFKRGITLRLRPPDSDYTWLPELATADGQPVTLENGITASVKSEPGALSTLVLRRERKSGGPGGYAQRNNRALLNPESFVEMMDVALRLVQPPAAPTPS